MDKILPCDFYQQELGAEANLELDNLKIADYYGTEDTPGFSSAQK